jgi:hypothetical protein
LLAVAFVAWKSSNARTFAGVTSTHLAPLADELRHRIRAVANDPSDEAHWLLAAAEPGALIRRSRDGSSATLARLEGTPLALAASADMIAVATDAAAPLYVLAGAGRELRGPYEIEPFATAAEIFPGQAGARFSTYVRALAICDERVWVATQDEHGEPQVNALAYDTDGDEFWKLPYYGYYDESAHVYSDEARDLRWCVGDGELWSVRGTEEGAHFTRWWPLTGETFFPGDERARAARDLCAAPEGGFYLVTADSALVRVAFPPIVEGESLLAELGRFTGLEPTRATSDQRIAAASARVLVAWNEHDANSRPLQARLWTWDVEHGLRELEILRDCEVVSLATRTDRGCIVVRGSGGDCDAAEIVY